MSETAIRRRKSERLTEDEIALYTEWRKQFYTQEDARIAAGISRGALERLDLKYSASPESIAKVRSLINPGEAA